MGGLFGSKTIHNTADKIAAFQVNAAAYGATVPVVFGTSRISGNIIDYYDFTSIAHTETQRAGKGGGKTKNTTYTYEVTCLLGLCEGTIADVERVWWDKEIYPSPASAGLTLFKGEIGQQPWLFTQSKYPERALPYSGLAYVAARMDLGNNAGLPNLNFEVKGLLIDERDGLDANPADVIEYIVFDKLNGVGFGTGGIDPKGLQQLRNYCRAADLLISSPSDTDTRQAYEIINEICQLTNTISFWSQNQLKLVPLCDEQLSYEGSSYIPNTIPEYDLSEDDFLETDDGRLVVLERRDNTDAYNQVKVEFVNRANGYEVETVDYSVLPDINNRGLRPAATEKLHWLHTKERAHYVAGVQVMKSLYTRNTYRFQLDWSFSLLEPGDLVTLTESTLGLDKVPVIIETAKEVDSATWEYTAVPRPPGVYSPGRYKVGAADRPTVDYRVDPGSIHEPVIFTAPAGLTETGTEVWCAVSGGANWGGCNVWVSNNNESYEMVGTIQGAARHGVLTNPLPADAAIDTTNVMQIKLVGAGQLLSASQQDAENLNTACWVDGEVVAYAVATLTGEKQYNLSYLVRGAADSIVGSHNIGAKFVRLDNGVFKYQVNSADIGKKIYLKFTSYNIYGIAEQGLDDVNAYTHTLGSHYVPQVNNLNAYQHYREIGDGTISYEVDVRFTPPDSSVYSHADVYVKSNLPNWDEVDLPWEQLTAPLGSMGDGIQEWKYFGKANNKFIYPNAVIGTTYTFKVITVDRFGFKADDTNAPIVTHTVEVKPYTPTPPQGFEIKFSDAVYCSWQPNTDTDIDFYELRLDGNKGATAGLLYKGNAVTATPELTNRRGKLYLYAHNPSGKYSTPLIYEYNKAAPNAPTAVNVAEVFQGLVLSCPPIPSTCRGVNFHVDSTVYYSANNSYTHQATEGIFTIQAAYVDIFGEGALSTTVTGVINPTINPEWIAAESLSLEKMDGTIKGAVEKARESVSLDIFQDVQNALVKADKDNATAIQQTGNNITNVVANLNKEPGATGYNAISKLQQTATGITQTVQDNKKELSSQITQTAGQIAQVVTELGKTPEKCAYTAIAQTNAAVQLRAEKEKLLSLINVCPEAITLKGKLINIDGDTKIADNLIVGRMIKTGSITSDKIAAKAIAADKLNVTSLDALTAKIGTLRTATTGARTEIKDNLIEVYDKNNVLRVRMGVW